MSSPLNLFADLPGRSADEVFQTLVSHDGVRIERIVSLGQASPPGFWYDQPQAEWVLVLSGKARVRVEINDHASELQELEPGQHLWIPAHQRHRVEWTDPTQPTVWLAVHWPTRGPTG